MRPAFRNHVVFKGNKFMSDNCNDNGGLIILLLFCLFLQCNNIESLQHKVDRLNDNITKILERKD